MFFMGIALLGGCASAPSPAPRTSAPPPAARTLDDVLDGDPDPRRNELVLVALSQIGAPYRWGGNSPMTGFDCSGLVVYVYQQVLRVVLPRTTFAQARGARSIPTEALRLADLVFYNTLGPAFSHVGLYIGNERFVHAPNANDVVRIENMRTGYWVERFNGARRVIV